MSFIDFFIGAVSDGVLGVLFFCAPCQVLGSIVERIAVKVPHFMDGGRSRAVECFTYEQVDVEVLLLPTDVERDVPVSLD
jgi:hypothetical protein